MFSKVRKEAQSSAIEYVKFIVTIVKSYLNFIPLLPVLTRFVG